MGRRRGKTKTERRAESVCVYCGELKVGTDEHVVPRCFFPDDARPSDSVIVRACNRCNSQKAKEDSYVRDLLVSDLANEGNPIARKVMKTVHRSIRKNRSDFGRDAIRRGSLTPLHRS